MFTNLLKLAGVTCTASSTLWHNTCDLAYDGPDGDVADVGLGGAWKADFVVDGIWIKLVFPRLVHLVRVVLWQRCSYRCDMFARVVFETSSGPEQEVGKWLEKLW